MVSYQKWTSIAQREAEKQGFNPTQQTQQDLISIVAEVWRDRKDEISTATENQARSIAAQEIDV